MTIVSTAARWIIAAVLAIALIAVLAWWFLVPRERTYALDFRQAYGSSDSTTVQVGVGSCLAPVTTKVVETATEVRIGVSIEWNYDDGCPDILEFVPVQLGSPLGDRAVVDESTGRAATLLAPEDLWPNQDLLRTLMSAQRGTNTPASKRSQRL
jgi:hypothetical protein